MIIFAAALVLISSSTSVECVAPTKGELEEIRATFKTKLLDNESARFAEVCKYTQTRGRKVPTVTFCGLMNAKNAYGAYTGFTPFHSTPQTGGAGTAQDPSDPPCVPDLGYCLGCMLPEKSLKECFAIRIKAIQAGCPE
jgi:hypothetical protein